MPRFVPAVLLTGCLAAATFTGCTALPPDATAEVPLSGTTTSHTGAPPADPDQPGTKRTRRQDAAPPSTTTRARSRRREKIPVPLETEGRHDPSKNTAAWMETTPDGSSRLVVQAPHVGTHAISAAQVLQSMRAADQKAPAPEPHAQCHASPTPDARNAEEAFQHAAHRGEEEYRFLLQMINAPDPAHADRVISIAQMPSHPFAPLAWNALGGLDTPASRAAIRNGLQEPHAATRCAALGAILRLDPAEATRHARRMVQDKHPDVRLAALTVLGETQDRASRMTVRSLADSDDPILRMRVGWVLMEMDDPEGARILRSFASTNDPSFAVQAMSILTNKEDEDTLPLLFHNLYHTNDRILQAALECIERFPESARNRALRRIPEEQRELLSNRRLLLLCHAGSFPVSSLVLNAARADHPSDRLYAMRALVRNGATRHLVTLIGLAFDPVAQIREEAQAGVREFLAVLNLQGAPTEFDNIREWQRWWFREHRILATAPGQVLLSLPNGETKPFHLGSRLDFDAVIESVRMGYGEDHREGALVMIDCAGRPYSLTP